MSHTQTGQHPDASHPVFQQLAELPPGQLHTIASKVERLGRELRQAASTPQHESARYWASQGMGGVPTWVYRGIEMFGPPFIEMLQILIDTARSVAPPVERDQDQSDQLQPQPR